MEVVFGELFNLGITSQNPVVDDFGVVTVDGLAMTVTRDEEEFDLVERVRIGTVDHGSEAESCGLLLKKAIIEEAVITKNLADGKIKELIVEKDLIEEWKKPKETHTNVDTGFEDRILTNSGFESGADGEREIVESRREIRVFCKGKDSLIRIVVIKREYRCLLTVPELEGKHRGGNRSQWTVGSRNRDGLRFRRSRNGWRRRLDRSRLSRSRLGSGRGRDGKSRSGWESLLRRRIMEVDVDIHVLRRRSVGIHLDVVDPTIVFAYNRNDFVVNGTFIDGVGFVTVFHDGIRWSVSRDKDFDDRSSKTAGSVSKFTFETSEDSNHAGGVVFDMFQGRTTSKQHQGCADRVGVLSASELLLEDSRTLGAGFDVGMKQLGLKSMSDSKTDDFLEGG